MATQEEFARRRLLLQQQLANALSQGSYASPGEPAAKAWQPALQQLGTLFQQKRLRSEEAKANKSMQDTLAEALSPVVTQRPDISPSGEVQSPQLLSQSMPRTSDEISQVLIKNPQTAGVGLQSFLENLKQREAGSQRLREIDAQKKEPKWKLGEIGSEGDTRQSVFYNELDPSQYHPVGKPIKKSGQQIDISVSTEKKYGEKFAEQIAKGDSDLRESAYKAPALAERANQIKEILSGGNVATGFGADFKLGFGKAAASAGFKGAEDYAANTEVLASGLAQNTLDAIKASGLGSGTGFSNADRDFLEKAVGGKITLEAKSIDRLADLAHRAASKSSERWNKRVREIPREAIYGTGISTDPVSVPDLFKSRSVKSPSNTGLTPEEQSELEQLRRELNRGR